jgi:hypothetical protein
MAGQVPINVLPDDALLEIFDFYVHRLETRWKKDDWITLVHVCQKWRNIVFRSSRLLNLQLVCKAGTPVRRTLAVWPPLPITIEQLFDSTRDGDNTNILAALENNDRIRKITFWDVSSPQERFLAAMQALTYLNLRPSDRTLPIIPNPILGGSAPQLRDSASDSDPCKLPSICVDDPCWL